MNEIIYMKAEYEPWWMFSGWEKTIIEKNVFTTDREAKNYLDSLLTKFRNAYPNESKQKGACWAFWTEDEQQFCEACDDDLQTYHGILWLKDGKPFQL
ncbi:DUF1033 family protein [Paenisporosarcina indica]|uniref:DUF1033 family protein n=1 Tax=Paenisporosarcina indica TaxID=650093 RepID=UPI0009502A86|nr:DUF1033 family protein [Paenisporosarcina indica]